MHQITTEEKKRAINCAVASVEMEGYSVPASDKALCMDVLDGKLSKEDFIKLILERCSV